MRRLDLVFVVMTIAVWVAALPLAAKAGTVNTVFAIPGFNDGASPNSPLTRLDGKFYGTTVAGGPTGAPTERYNGNGVVYQVDLKTGAESVVYSFDGAGNGAVPGAGLVAFDGKLYGTTFTGGPNSSGVVFSFDPATRTQTVVYALPAQTYGLSRLTLYHGMLYGTGDSQTSPAVIFSVDPVAGSGQIVYEFPRSGSEGSNPGNLLVHGNYLFGTAYVGGKSGGGTLFRFDPATNKLHVAHDFTASGDGKNPSTDLVAFDGLLYGTTDSGGATANGTIFSFNPETKQEAVAHDFTSTEGAYPHSGLLVYNDLLYGQTSFLSTNNSGSLYAFDPATASLSIVHAYTQAEGVGSGSLLSEMGGLLYATIYYGGVNGDGSVVSVDPTSGALTVVHDFAGAQAGGASGLIKVNGALIGTSAAGGAHGFGSIYKVDPKTGSGETLYSFQGTDGANPMAALTNIGGVLYGTTYRGGVANGGMVFSFALQGRKMTILNSFSGKAGANPTGPLAMIDNALFGTTTSAGQGGKGTIFKIDLTSGHVSTLANFSTNTGDRATGLIAAGGLLYGTTQSSGAFGNGTIFSVDPSTGMVTALYAFMGHTDGANPSAPLLAIGGLLYGTTDGTPRDKATVFVFDTATNSKTTLHSLGKSTQIEGAMIEKGGQLYGTYPYADFLNEAYGGVFRTNPVHGGTTMSVFSPGTSTNPAAPLILSNNALFGTTISSSSANAGTVFKYIP